VTLTEVYEDTFAASLTMTGRRPGRSFPVTITFVNESGGLLTFVAVGGEAQDQTVFLMPEGPAQQVLPEQAPPEQITPMQALPGYESHLMAWGAMPHFYSYGPTEFVTGSVLNSNVSVQPQSTHTDDGGTSLWTKSILDMDEGVKRLTSHVLPLPPSPVEQPQKEPHQEALEWIKVASGLSWENIGEMLDVSRQALVAWRRGEPIRREHLQRLLATREVLERAVRNNPRPTNLRAWLYTPRRADAKTPADLLKAGEIGRVRLLAVTTPSPKVKVPSQRMQRQIPEAYRSSRERIEAVPPERDEELLEMLDEDDED
jgi:hypothetical protein